MSEVSDAVAKRPRLQFSTRLLACVVVPSVLFVAALAVCLWGLWKTNAEYDRVSQAQGVAARVNEVTALNLVAGQGVRDLALDPSNRPARDGIKASHAKVAELIAQASRSSQGQAQGNEQAEALKKIDSLQQAHGALQREIVQLIRDKPGEVIGAIVDRETPSWRALQGELARVSAIAAERAAQAQRRADEASTQAAWWAAGLACAAFVVAVALCIVLQRDLRRELGGDPELARQGLLRVADGDLREDPHRASVPEQSMLGVVQQMRSSLHSTVVRVHEVTGGVAAVAGEIAEGNRTLSERTEQASGNLVAASSSIAQLAERIERASQVASQANELAGSANAVASRGGEVVQQMVQNMGAISTSSQQVAEIVGLIEGIAFQTNLLALNASVEAARAGEQGRGFAVVADEVRTLAQRSHQAARQIKELIERSASEVQAGTQRVEEAGKTMHDIVQATRRVSEMMHSLSHAASEQAGHIGQVNATVSGLETLTRQNAALVEESAIVSERLKDQADELARIVGSFKVVTPESAEEPV